MTIRALLVACSLLTLGGAARAELYSVPLKNKAHHKYGIFGGPYTHSTFKVRLQGKDAYKAALELQKMAEERGATSQITFGNKAKKISDHENLIFEAKGTGPRFGELHRSLGTLSAKYNKGEIYF